MIEDKSALSPESIGDPAEQHQAEAAPDSVQRHAQHLRALDGGAVFLQGRRLHLIGRVGGDAFRHQRLALSVPQQGVLPVDVAAPEGDQSHRGQADPDQSGPQVGADEEFPETSRLMMSASLLIWSAIRVSTTGGSLTPLIVTVTVAVANSPVPSEIW